MDKNLKVFAAELIGTAVLMLGGPGSAILAAKGGPIGVLGVALAFGFTLLLLAYAIGGISGCHVNPAVSIGMWIARKIKTAELIYYIVAQLVGAFLGGLIIWIIAKGQKGFDATGNFAQNGYGKSSPGGFNLGAAIVVEIVFTALLMFVVLSTTHGKFPAGFAGLAIGITLAVIHLVTIPVDNTSVNPARSFGAAVFAGSGALKQLWAFIVFPIVGAVVGVLAWLAVDDGKLEDTMLGDSKVMTRARDMASDAVHKAAGAADRAID
jgi:aquaporin Z